MSTARPLQPEPAAAPEQPSPTPAAPGVQVEGVNKSYRRGQRVLSDVTLHIRAGETFGIIGPNGAGKTTLFGCMLGLLWPDTGTVRVAGPPPDHLEVRRVTGYLPERLTFAQGLTARQLLAFHHHALAERPSRERPQMERDVFNNDYAARGINTRYIPVKLKDRRQEEGENPPAVQALINEHGVHAFPSFALVGPDGKAQRLTRGYNGYTGTLQFLRIPTPSGRRPAPIR